MHESLHVKSYISLRAVLNNLILVKFNLLI